MQENPELILFRRVLNPRINIRLKYLIQRISRFYLKPDCRSTGTVDRPPLPVDRPACLLLLLLFPAAVPLPFIVDFLGDLQRHLAIFYSTWHGITFNNLSPPTSYFLTSSHFLATKQPQSTTEQSHTQPAFLNTNVTLKTHLTKDY